MEGSLEERPDQSGTYPTSDVFLWAAEGEGGWGSSPIARSLI